MKSWQAEEFGAVDEVLKLVEVPELGPPPADCVTVKVITAGVGLPDVLMTQGRYPLVTETPVSPGQEVVGIVTDVAPGVDFAVGDRVMGLSLFMGGFGGFSEYCYMSTKQVMSKAPEGMSDEHAATFLIRFLTAQTGLVQRAKLVPGETLLVLGAAGGTGTAAVQFGKALGAKVIAVAGGAEKVAFCNAQGADYVVDYREGEISEQVQALVDSVDVIFDPVGGAACEDAVKAIGIHGRLVLIGYGSGSWPQLDPADMVSRSYTAMGVFPLHCTREELDGAYAQLFGNYKEGKISVAVDKIYSFDEVPQALASVSNLKMLGKHVVRVASED